MTEIIVSDSRRFLLPDAWNELSYEQLFDNAIHIFEYNIVKEEATKAYLKTKIALHLSGFNEADAKNEFLQTEIATKILPLMDWMFDSNTLSEQKLPSIRLRKNWSLCRLYGPSSDFMNLSFEEFDDAEYWFHELMNPDTEQRQKTINILCAILYRPYSDTIKGDTRVAYSPHDNEARSRWFENCDTRHKLCVLLWYMGCRTRMIADFAPLFGGGGEGGGSLTMLAHSLARPVLGNIDELNRRTVRQVLTEMLRLYNMAQRQEESNAQKVA